jgi:hypothetical protein
MEHELDLRCSFCGKAPEEVDQMIATHKISQKLSIDRYATSLKAAICDECVRRCVEILEEAQAVQPPET